MGSIRARSALRATLGHSWRAAQAVTSGDDRTYAAPSEHRLHVNDRRAIDGFDRSDLVAGSPGNSFHGHWMEVSSGFGRSGNRVKKTPVIGRCLSPRG